MNDRELLEFAAKAAGYPRTKWDEQGWFYVCGYEAEWLGPSDFELWNPLADDGDALRLAVKCDIAFNFDRAYPDGKLVARVCCTFGDTLYGDAEPADIDPYAATRRAIVRAAAEIGKSL